MKCDGRFVGCWVGIFEVMGEIFFIFVMCRGFGMVSIGYDGVFEMRWDFLGFGVVSIL